VRCSTSEVTAHLGGELAEVARPDVGIVTSVAMAHVGVPPIAFAPS
jgi:hypothetical protein